MNNLLRNELTGGFKQTNSNEYENEYYILRLNEDGSVTRIVKNNNHEYTFNKTEVYKRLDNNKSWMKKYYLDDTILIATIRGAGTENYKDYINSDKWELVETVEL